MDSIYKYIIQIVEQLPIAWRIVALAAIGITMYAVRFFLSRNMQEKTTLWMSKQLSRISINELRTSQLFAKRNYFEHKINTISFDCQVKDEVFRIILNAKLSKDLENMRSFIDNNNLNKLSNIELCDSLHKLTKKMICDYEKEAKLQLSIKYGEVKAKNIFNFVMNHEIGFRQKRIDRLNRMVEFIDENLKESKIYDNNNERVAAYMYEIQSLIGYTIANAVKMFKSLNGEIYKIINN